MSPPRAALIALATLAIACGGSPDATPTGAVRELIDALEPSSDPGHDHERLEHAYALLSERSRTDLAERARQTAALGAAERPPSEMLVAGTAHLRFHPRPGGFREQIDPRDPDRATVTVSGDGEGETATIPLVREDGRWRIELVLDGAPPAP
ncbi:MAG: hypothetical protein U0234_01305 [Sandaracinus sp.]